MSAVPNEGLFFKPQTLGQLRDVFLAHLERQHSLGRYAARTVRYYRIKLNKWVEPLYADPRSRRWSRSICRGTRPPGITFNQCAGSLTSRWTRD